LVITAPTGIVIPTNRNPTVCTSVLSTANSRSLLVRSTAPFGLFSSASSDTAAIDTSNVADDPPAGLTVI
jgi:hypothetical protein